MVINDDASTRSCSYRYFMPLPETCDWLARLFSALFSLIMLLNSVNSVGIQDDILCCDRLVKQADSYPQVAPESLVSHIDELRPG